MVYIPILTTLFATWLAYLLPKEPMDRPAWTNPRAKVLVIIALSVASGVVLGLVYDNYLVTLASVVIPLLTYLFSENQEVSRRMQYHDKPDKHMRRIYRNNIRKRG